MPRVRVISFADDSDEPKRRLKCFAAPPKGLGARAVLLTAAIDRGAAGPEDLAAYVAKLEALHRDPNRKDLRWQLDIDDDVLSGEVRHLEFRNWINKVVLPRAAGA